MNIIELPDETIVTNQLKEWLANNAKGKTLFLACGGSATTVIAQAWQALPDTVKGTMRVTLTDERYGPVGHPDSNWRILQEKGMDLTDPRHVPVLRGLGPEETAAAWEADLRELLDWADTVLAVFGIGVDSHIAGIKPGSPAATEQQHLTSYFKGEDFERITITPLVFPHIHQAVIYTKGPEKKAVLELLDQELDPVQYPDQLIKQTGSFSVYYQV